MADPVDPTHAREICEVLAQGNVAERPKRIAFAFTLEQVQMIHHALANLGNTDPLKMDAFRELFAKISAHVQPKTP